MKGIISKIPVTIASRSGSRQGIIFMAITEDRRSYLGKFRTLTIQDFEAIPKANPVSGEAAYDYNLIEETSRKRFFTEIDQVWAQVGIDIYKNQSLENQLEDVYANFLLADTMENPVRDSSNADWELHDTETALNP